MEACNVSLVLQLLPSMENARHSEGAFIRLQDGSILFAWSRYQGAWHDDAPSDIYGITSRDEGQTWGQEQLLISAASRSAHNVMSVSFLRMQNGDVGLFYLAKTNPFTYQVWLARSSDEGLSFPIHQPCSQHQGDGIYVMNNDRVRRLKSGRIILPLAHHRVSRLKDGGRYYDYRAFTTFLYSDDDGHSFQESPQVITMPHGRSSSGLQEPGVIELSAGLLWAFMRTDLLCHYESFSHDNGQSWTLAQPSNFSGPCSPLLLTRNPYTQHIYAIYNPIPNYQGRRIHQETGGRSPLVLSRSRDNGQSFEAPRLIAGDADRGYCYPAAFFTEDGCLLLAYCAGSVAQGSCLKQTDMVKIRL